MPNSDVNCRWKWNWKKLRPAEQVDIEIVVEMLIDIAKHPLHAGMVATGEHPASSILLGTDHG